MLQSLVNVWWLFASGFALGALLILSAKLGLSSRPDPRNDWTKNASNFLGGLFVYLVGRLLLGGCGLMLLICLIGYLVH